MVIPDYIKSKDVSDYLKQQHYLFSDEEKATLIFNSGYPIRVILDELKVLMQSTDDVNLVKEIQERIEYENVLYDMLVSSEDSIIFHLEVKEEEEFEHFGLFKNYETALSLAKTFHKEFVIWKRRIMPEEIDAAENMMFNDELGMAQYTADGDRMYYWCRGVGYELLGDGSLGSRFEEKFLSFPYPFKVGDIVRNIRTGRTGIISELVPEESEGMEFSDFVVTVEYASEGHEHVFPGDLEYCMKD